MPDDTHVKPGTPSKNRENQDSAVFTQSQPSTIEEVEARSGRSKTGTPSTDAEAREEPGAKAPRRDGDPFDQSDRATDADVHEHAAQSPSRLAERDA